MHDGRMPDEDQSQEGSIRGKKAFLLRTAMSLVLECQQMLAFFNL